MKVATNTPGKYINPRKTHRTTAAQRRGQQMVQNCRQSEPVTERRGGVKK